MSRGVALATFDEVTLICKGCRGERKFNVLIVGAEAVKAWLDRNATRCPNALCSATHCDVRLRVSKAN